MNNSFSESYKKAGVDVTAGYKAVELMKSHIARTMTAGALSGIGGFGGLFELDMTGISKPVLVSGTDGVGTKIKIAFMGYHINDDIMAVAKADAMVQHCLPAHREEEITEKVFEAHANEIFEEAENRLHAQKAVMVKVMGPQE